MIGKVICYGDTRNQALARMRIAMSEMVVEGIKTNIPLHRELLIDEKFVLGGTSIHYLEKRLAARHLALNSRSIVLVEITLTADDHSAEVLADALIECGALSVSIEDASAGGDEEPAVWRARFRARRHAWARSRLRVLAEHDGADAMIAAASASTQIAAAIEKRAPVRDIDWVRETQSQFAPTRISERLWIVPSWHQPPDEHAVVVRLDPGFAFGTGTHPTTRLCLAWLDETLRRSQRARLWLRLRHPGDHRGEARRRRRRGSRHRSAGP